MGEQKLIKQQSQKQNRERTEDKEAWERKEVNGQPQIYLTSQLNPVWTARTKLLFWRTSAVQMIKATFTGQWGKPWTKLLEACQQKKYEGAGPITIQFLFLKKNPILPLKWSDSTYKPGHSQLIQAEEGIISPVARKAKSGICIMKLRIGVAALRNNLTPGLQSSQMHWLFCRIISLSVNVCIRKCYRWKPPFTGRKQTLFNIKCTCHLILLKTHPQTIKKPNKSQKNL